MLNNTKAWHYARTLRSGSLTCGQTYLDGVVGPKVILIDSLEPAHVVVSVADEMNIQLVLRASPVTTRKSQLYTRVRQQNL